MTTAGAILTNASYVTMSGPLIATNSRLVVMNQPLLLTSIPRGDEAFVYDRVPVRITCQHCNQEVVTVSVFGILLEKSAAN